MSIPMYLPVLVYLGCLLCTYVASEARCGFIRPRNTQASIIHIVRTPDIVKEGLTKSANLRCSLLNNAMSAGGSEAPNIVELVSIAITRHEVTVAKVTKSIPAQVIDGSENLNAIGEAFEVSQGERYINLTWQAPAKSQLNHLRCTIVYLDGNGHDQSETKAFSFVVKQPSITDVVKHMQVLETQNMDAENRIQVLETQNMDAVKHMQVLETQNMDAVKHMQVLETQNMDAVKHMQVLETQNMDAENRIQILEAKNMEAETRTQILEAGNTNASNRIGILEDEIKELTSNNTDINIKVMSLINETNHSKLVDKEQNYVIAKLPRYTGLQVRLIGGDGRSFGAVQLTNWGSTGYLCDDHFNSTNKGATVVCRMLGFSQGTPANGNDFVATISDNHFGFDDVKCTGHEGDLDACAHKPWGEENCKGHELAGVRCT